MEPRADLQHAFRIRYQKRINQVWSASFYLPHDDIHADECTLQRFVEIYDGTTRVELFRIIDRKVRRLATRKVWWFGCEHASATLNDGMLVDVHNAGVTGQTTGAINYILDRQDPVRWKLGTCDWSRNFLYRWENKTLLEALLEIPKRFNEDYQWTFDTTDYPWTLNLISPSVAVDAYIDYGRNLQEITREEDARELYTRLYAFGQGVQGAASQVNLRSANPTGEDFIDADTIGTYGIITRVWIDQRYSTSQTLYDAAVEKLDLRKAPLYRYTFKVADIHRLTHEGIDEFTLGAYVRITDEELGIDVSTRVVEISKPDVRGKPGDVTIQTANKLWQFTDLADVVYAPDLDEVVDGGTFARVLSTSISAGEILLSMIAGGTLGAFPATPSIAGLYLGASHLGYHDGSVWKTYMDIDGNFYLGGTGGTLQWDELAGTLVIAGTGLPGIGGAPSAAGLYLTSGYLGYWSGAAWDVYIKSDGTFDYGGNLTWDGSTLAIEGVLTCTDKIKFTAVSPYLNTITGIEGLYLELTGATQPNIVFLPTVMLIGCGTTLGNAITIGETTGHINFQAATGAAAGMKFFFDSGYSFVFSAFYPTSGGVDSAVHSGYIQVFNGASFQKIYLHAS